MRSRRPAFMIALCGLIVLGAASAGASFLGDDIYVLSVGRGEGASGSYWYTSTWFHNPSSDAVEVTVSLLLRDQANPTPEQQIVTVQAASTLTFRDAIENLFGLDHAVGALRVQSTGPIAVGARVFNQPGDSISESQGQLMAGVPASFAVGPGESVEVPGILQPADGTFRSNFGLVETSGSPAEVTVTLVDADGSELGADTFTLGPYGAFQRSLASLAPDAHVDGGILRVEVTGADGAVLAFASAVASGVHSQDPTTLEMTLEPLLLDHDHEDLITGVEPGPGLAGGGSEGVVSLQVVAGDGIEVSSFGVSIKEFGVTAEHIAAGEVVLGTKVGNNVLTDVVTLEAGSNVNVEAEGNTVAISAFGCFGERQEAPVTQDLVADTADGWVGGYDQLSLPAAGRWRIGYRVLVEIRNDSYSTVSDPVNVALYDTTEREIVRGSMSVLGLQVDLNSSVFATVSGEAVVELDRATTVTLAARSSRNDLSLTIHPHDFDLSANLSPPDAASYFYSECIHLD